MPKSTYLADAIIDQVLRGSRFTPPLQVYVGLFTVSPTGVDNGTEVSSPEYDRPVVLMAPAQGRTTSNSTQVVFPEALVPWGSITAFGLFDAHVGGNLLYFGPFTTPKLVTAFDLMVFEIGQLVLVEN